MIPIENPNIWIRWRISLDWDHCGGMSILTSYMFFIMVIYNLEKEECQHLKFV